MITKFSNEVKEKLKHYVYRLVNPMNGQTFYVGEGCGDRVFNHANAVDMTFYNNKEILTDEDQITDDNDDPAKIKTIMEIKNKGLNVIHIIQRWGMNKETAFEVEAALIDYFGLEHLTNKIKGHDIDRGMRWADELENEFTAEEFVDYPIFKEKFILIKIKDYWINRNGGLNPDSIYKTVRGNWALKLSNAKDYKYVVASRYGIVVGVYEVNTNGWKQCSDNKRIYFDGVEAPKIIKEHFMGKKIPLKYKKRQNPAGYCK